MDKIKEFNNYEKNVKLYIVGIPVDYSYEDKVTITEYKNVLKKAKSNFWPVYIWADVNYYRYLTKDGWKTLEKINIPVYFISTPAITECKNERYQIVANTLNRLTEIISTPIISLHPGNPFIADVTTQLLLQKFKNKKNLIKIIPARSGIDIVGDIAEKKMGKKNLSRQYLLSFEILENKLILNKDMILISCLSNAYTLNNDLFFFRNVAIKLFKLGFGNKPIFIKSPKMKGILTTGIGLLKKMGEFNPADHYTLAIINSH